MKQFENEGGERLSFSCCNIAQSPDGYYVIDHPTKGTCRVYFSPCCDCGRPILKVDAGLFRGKVEYMRCKDSERFLKKHPCDLLTPPARQEKDNPPGFTYFDGKSTAIKYFMTDNVNKIETKKFRQKSLCKVS